MAKKVKRIFKSADVKFISLCPAGANEMETILKELGSSGKDTFQIDTLTKEIEGNTLVSVVYAAGIPDADGDMATEDVVKEMAHSFMSNKGDIDIRHDNKPVGKERAYVAESFTVEKGSPILKEFKTVNGDPIDSFAWITKTKILDEELLAKYKSGEWNGVSMGGRASFEKVEKESEESKLVDVLKSFLVGLFKGDSQFNKESEIDMKLEDIEKMVANTSKEMMVAVLKEHGIIAGKSEEVDLNKMSSKELEEHLAKKKQEESSQVDLNKMSVKELEEHLAKKKLENIDLNNVEQVRKHLESLEKQAPAESEALKKAKEDADAANKNLSAVLRKSNQSYSEPIEKETERVAKENEEAVYAGFPGLDV